MKIAMLGAKAVPAIGGVAHYIEELGARLALRGHEVTVYCRPHFLAGSSGDYRGMHRVATGGLRGKHLDATSHTITSILHAVRQDFDIMHVHGSAPGAFSPLLRLRRGAGVVLTVHGLDWSGSKWGGLASRLMYLGARVAASGAHQLVAVSQATAEAYRQRVGREPLFIPTGMELPEPVPAQEITALGLSAGSYVFCAARLVQEKGVHYLVEAFASLETDKTLVIAGNCPYEDDYVRHLRAMANDRVVFAGYVTGRLLAELYSNAYLYVQPSEAEGLPIALLEAMSYGRYVLASDIAPNREALGSCGGTFRARDVGDLRDKLKMLLARPEVIAGEFEQARSLIRRERDWEVTTELYEKLYESLHRRDAALLSHAEGARPRAACSDGAHLEQ